MGIEEGLSVISTERAALDEMHLGTCVSRTAVA